MIKLVKPEITINNLLYPLPICFFLTSWEILAHITQTPLFPPLSKVVIEFWFLLGDGILLESLGSSLIRVLIGYSLGSLAGLLVGILMGLNKVVERSLSPLISMLFPIPTLGWLPLLMLWIGINEALPVTLIFICAFFPVAYNTLTGIKGVQHEYIKTARTLGASPWFILWHVTLPMALPNIFTGLRLEAGMVWRTVIAAEMFAIPTGIGALLINAESLIRVDVILVCLVLLSMMCTIFERMFLWLEYKTTGTWR
ncbi:ABC transporter permease [Desulfoscipio gibsoniae]|uniref:ABC-type nitrate/sulfonate/bicarbonate transport system, permease component n=1 Tax=Desulfoscipio gibsoniae DSM 7213 TaxID=767817 RepID=R4KFG5_9FIRM|nr:ABC transporter permease [Desulfoscipio gibsoniae]AGL00402.1 ABC-type nitrate/sulfonate/bicarbonate transport system, permease component [Desulfoscipio gibsoniae DSM 7213]